MTDFKEFSKRSGRLVETPTGISMETIKFKELLQNWEDADVTQYYLACCLGLIDYDESFTTFRASKHLFWTRNPTSDLLWKLLREMLDDQLLKFDEEENKFCWNNSFVGG